MSTLLTRTTTGRFQAHELDVDILCEASSKEAAIEKLRIAVEEYIAFGISKGWEADIPFPAPQEYWNRLEDETPRSD